MNLSDILQWVGQFVLGVILVYIALRKAPSEKSSLNGGATKAYAESAKIAGEIAKEAKEEMLAMEREHQIEMVDLKKRLEILENKKYRITIDFTIGEPPTVGVVKIEPIICVESEKK